MLRMHVLWDGWRRSTLLTSPTCPVCGMAAAKILDLCWKKTFLLFPSKFHRNPKIVSKPASYLGKTTAPAAVRAKWRESQSHRDAVEGDKRAGGWDMFEAWVAHNQGDEGQRFFTESSLIFLKSFYFSQIPIWLQNQKHQKIILQICVCV